jgi:hypothetical protein
MCGSQNSAIRTSASSCKVFKKSLKLLLKGQNIEKSFAIQRLPTIGIFGTADPIRNNP